MKLNPKSEIRNPKQCPNSQSPNVPNLPCFICFFLIFCFSVVSFAQDANRLVTLSKQIIEANTNEEVYPLLKESADLYLKENKYNEFADYLGSLAKQKPAFDGPINYYLGYARYYQLKYLEQIQAWDEYFAQGNAYREEIINSLQKITAADAMGVYAKLILWKFHQDQNDALSDSALADLLQASLEYAKSAQDLTPLKDVAADFLRYNEKARAKELYKIYVDKIVASEIKDDELKAVAAGFYKEGNLDLAEAIYDVYIERITKSLPQEKILPALIEIAQSFVYRDEGIKDMLYAEEVFKKIEAAGGKDAFSEELMYLRGFNLEKTKEYLKAKDVYSDLMQKYPQTLHADEVEFKTGIIYTYILRDIKNGRAYFEKLAQKEIISPQVISGLYQLGLLSQWEEDSVKAKEFYQKLLEKAKDSFPETLNLAKERLKEIEETKPIEYNLKMFLDASLKEEYADLAMTKVDLRSHPQRAKKDTELNIGSTAYTAESGCLVVTLQYLWSGHLAGAKPSFGDASFTTTYNQAGTKEINLVVVSPAGIIDRSIDIVDLQ